MAIVSNLGSSIYGSNPLSPLRTQYLPYGEQRYWRDDLVRDVVEYIIWNIVKSLFEKSQPGLRGRKLGED